MSDAKRLVDSIRPLHDFLLIQRCEAEAKIGSIIVPDNAKPKSTDAIVLAVGPGKTLEDGTVRPLDVKAGDRIVFGKYNGTDVKLDGEHFIVLRESEILGVYES